MKSRWVMRFNFIHPIKKSPTGQNFSDSDDAAAAVLDLSHHQKYISRKHVDTVLNSPNTKNFVTGDDDLRTPLHDNLFQWCAGIILTKVT